MMPQIFSIRLPEGLEWFLVQIALPLQFIVPDLLPAQCVWPWTRSFVFDLVFDTTWPAALSGVLIVIARLLNWRYGEHDTLPSHEEDAEEVALQPRKRHFGAVLAEVCSDLVRRNCLRQLAMRAPPQVVCLSAPVCVRECA